MAPSKTRVDYEQLTIIAQSFDQQQDQIAAMMQALRRQTAIARGGAWQGQAAAAFLAEMDGTVLPGVARLTDALGGAREVVFQISAAFKAAERDAAQVLKHDDVLQAGNSGATATSSPNAIGAGQITPEAPVAPFTRSTPPPPSAHDRYLEQALKKAGISPETWDPSKGVAGNAHTIRAVYDYYGKLFLDDPRFEWAGMARYTAMQTFYPAFMQVHALKASLQDAETATRVITFLMPGAQVTPELIAAIRADIEFMEQKLLAMQKDIFEDIATQHEAFKSDGMDGIRRLHSEGRIDMFAVEAWEDIASGDPARISRGNAALLRREQFTVLQGHYDDLRTHQGMTGYDGRALTLMMSVMASSPMPKNVGHFWDTRTGADISRFEDRWAWAGGPMLTEWQRMLATDPVGTRDYLGKPMDSVMKERISTQIDEITDSPMWRVPVDSASPIPFGIPFVGNPVERAAEEAFERLWPIYVEARKP